MNNILKTILLFSTVLAMVCATWAQSRDRRVDRENRCFSKVNVSSTGQLWMCDRCGHVWLADSIGASWRAVVNPESELFMGSSFEQMAAFGNGTAVAYRYGKPYRDLHSVWLHLELATHADAGEEL